MDNSQSSDFLSESTDIFYNSPNDQDFMDTTCVPYASLLSNTKLAFSNIRKEIKKSIFSVNFSTLLEDCGSCISQGLNLITDLLNETDLKKNKLVEYMNDAVSLLQLLSDLIKNVIESISLSCCSMKNFPTATGRIIMLVFIHCKDSESLYGSHLNYVEKQLKDLFRICHDLQLTYLMVLEKHFIFDLTEREEQDILIEALDINLKIGEIVQSLDVKTMAEQWKAYTMICEKYSSYLQDKNICSDCTKILCSMITTNIKSALEENQEEKIVLRSLKVSTFTLKILLRICNTFRHASMKDYKSITELLLYVHLNNEAYLQTICGKPLQFVNLYNNNVTSQANLLLSELLTDEKLFSCICNYNNELRRDDKLLGLILLIISVIKMLVQKSKDQSLKLPKYRLINVVYSILPHCHVWFNMGLKFNCDNKSSRHLQTYGLYEHLLTHMLALAITLNAEEANVLEKSMVKAVLSTDCCSALFSSNLWLLLARMSNRQYLLSQVISLSKIYQKLENNRLFIESPQKVHLTNTISRLFEVMHNKDKIRIYNMFSIHDDKNITLWKYLKLGNLPNEIQINAEEVVLEKFKVEFSHMSDEIKDIDLMINIINLASTCKMITREDEMEALLINAWMKSCPNNLPHLTKRLDKGNIWFYKYIEALACLTISMEHIFHGSSANVAKVLHVLSNIVQSSCKEFKLLLIDILCKLTRIEHYDVNKDLVESIFKQTFSDLFQGTDSTVNSKLYNALRKSRTPILDNIITEIVKEDDTLQETWNYFKRHGRLNKIDIDLKQQLLFTLDFKYCHKCLDNKVIEIRDSDSLNMQNSGNNFDFVDIDSLFDGESDAEPACKKVKLNTNEVQQIINRLETDVSLLCKIKENVFTNECKSRIRNVCNRLNNIIE